MERNQLEFYLNRGNSFGFELTSEDNNYISWVSLDKNKVDQRKLEVFTEEEMSALYEEQRLNEKQPYVLRIAELKKEVYDSDRYTQNDDYKRNDIYRFSSLEEVSYFLSSYNLDLKDIRWYSEIKAD